MGGDVFEVWHLPELAWGRRLLGKARRWLAGDHFVQRRRVARWAYRAGDQHLSDPARYYWSAHSVTGCERPTIRVAKLGGVEWLYDEKASLGWNKPTPIGF